MAGGKLRRGEITEPRQRPLMLKDFLRYDCSSTKNINHQSNANESATTVRYLLQMESKNNRKGIGIVSSKPSFWTLSALQKASEAMAKFLPFSTQPSSQQRRSTTVLQKHNINKLSSILKRVASMKETHYVKGSLARKLSCTVKRLSRLGHHSKTEAEIPIRVRDIVRWRSFGDEDISYNQYCNSRIGTSDSFSHSRGSNRTWSEFGNESFSASNLRSFSGLSREADGLKDEMLLLTYHSGEEDEVSTEEALDGSPIHQRGSDSLDLADSCCSNEQEKTDNQQLEDGDDGSTVCCSLEGYEEKEQLSPVSVLDFPFEEDEEVATSSFEESLANLERTKQQLLHKINRYEALAKLDPLDLDKHFSSRETGFSDEDSDSFTYYDSNNVDDPNDDIEDLGGYINQILNNFLDASVKRRWGAFELLVIDVFHEELSCGCEPEENVLIDITAERIKEWLLKDNETDESRELCVMEMERNQDWRKFKMDEEEIVAEMEVEVLQHLVDDLLIDLMS